MMHKEMLFISIICLFTSCQSNQNRQKSVDNLSQWRNDKFGCSGFRNYNNTKLLSDSLKLSNLNNKEVIELLGEPDIKKKYENNETYMYYFDSICSQGKLVDSLDKCTLTISFLNKSKGTTISFPCN
jgi:hypothetical protein